MCFIDVHTHNNKPAKNVVALINVPLSGADAGCFPVYCSLGIHPWNISQNCSLEMEKLSFLASWPQVKAIGEAGLDKAIEVDYKLQKEVFLLQADLAQKLNKPMILHAVRSYYDLISIRKLYDNAHPWVIHGFNGNEIIAKELLRHGFYLSFDNRVLNPNSSLRNFLATLPMDRIFLETDDEKIHPSEIYKFLAALYGMDIDLLKLSIKENFDKVFGI